MPVHIVEKLSTIVQSENKLRTELRRDPRCVEIARDVDLPCAEVEWIMRSARIPVSLDTPLGDDGGTEYGDLLADDAPSPEDIAGGKLGADVLADALATLTVRERRVLELRFGLGGEAPATLEEVGTVFSVTRERIRQIEQSSLRKLSALSVMRALRSPV